MAADKYDLIIIGSGQAGVPLAVDAAKAGMKTALIERSAVGGACVNTACTPTKTMIASATAVYRARRMHELGVHVENNNVWVKLEEVRERKRSMVEKWRGGSEKKIDKAEGLTLLRGEARFTESHTLCVKMNDSGETISLTAPKIVINTGSHATIPDIDGLKDVPYLDEAGIMELANPPMHLLILGGGAVGVEFAQMFRRFGSEVTILDRSPRLLDREDPEVSDAVAAILRDEGIRLELNVEMQGVQKAGYKYLQVGITAPSGRAELVGSHILIASGRTPNTADLDLAKAGIETDDDGCMPVNEQLETNVSGVYAAGDVKGGPMYTHVSYDDYRLLKRRLIGGDSVSTRDRLIPRVTYLDPQVAHIGMTEAEAREANPNVGIARMDMKRVARAIETDDMRGFMKAVVDTETGRILGFSMVGAEAGEVMSIVQMAMLGGLPYTTLRDGIFAHPTLAEGLNNLFLEIK